ncbi:hypothetical protein AYI70_g11286 [Smittium culicis]|uniref:Uncharacterized protein n=1 Tax=Smittium culicis TaxID=133412 RepID=A0A1R1X2H9_9FUNG|nr:hypothetical protein AYI70_g11286 [Smittium culicis]
MAKNQRIFFGLLIVAPFAAPYTSLRKSNNDITPLLLPVPSLHILLLSLISLHAIYTPITKSISILPLALSAPNSLKYTYHLSEH